MASVAATDARIDAHRPATDRLGPEWRIPLYEL